MALLAAVVVGAVPASAGVAAVERDASSVVDRVPALPDDVVASARARALELEGPEAVQARKASRTAYGGLSDSLARELAAAKFPGAVTAPVYRGLGGEALGDGARVKGYTGPVTAKVRDGSGETGLAVSSVPVRSSVGSGKPEAVDLRLAERDGVAVSANPLVAARFGLSANDGVRFPGSGLAMHLEGADGAGGEVADDRVFYANALADTDAWLTPVPGGAEWFLQLRSAASPERFAFRLDLPEGVALRQDKETVELVRDGKPVGGLSPVVAHDADGRPVAGSYTVDGDRVVLELAHRERDLAYPLLVDPQVWPGFDWRCQPGTGCDGDATAAGWASGTTGGPYETSWSNYLTVCAFLTGLCARSLPGGYASGASAWWSYNSIRQSYVTRFYANMSTSPYWECQGAGILKPTFAYEGNTGYRCASGAWNVTACVASDCNWSSGTEGNAAVMSVAKLSAVTQPSGSYGWGLMSDGNVVLYDRNAPSVTGHGYWLGASSSVSGHDDGLGVRQARIHTAGAVRGVTTHSCTGARPDPCPADWAATVAFGPDHNGVSEGEQSVSVDVVDVIDRVSSPVSFAGGVDWTGPSIGTPSGTLWDHRDGSIGEGSYGLHVSATDGDPATAATRRSGVVKLQLVVDGIPQAAAGSVLTQPCAGPGWSCAMAGDFTITGAALGPGAHKILVRASDLAGNASDSAQVAVSVHRADDAGLGPGQVNLRDGEFTTTASDVSVPGGPGIDLAITRTFQSKHLTGDTVGAFGPGWSVDLPADQPGADFPELQEGYYDTGSSTSVYAQLLSGSGEAGDLNFTYDHTGTDGRLYYTAPAGASDLSLVKTPGSGGDPATFTLTDADHNKTVYGPDEEGLWTAKSTETSSGTGTALSKTAVYVWDLTTDPPRITKVIGPHPNNNPSVPDQSSCNVGSPANGCRLLTLVYATGTTASGTGETQWGDIQGQVKQIDLTACAPSADGSSCPGMSTDTVARYAYDNTGRLRAAWDPRLSPALKTKYDYDANGRLSVITPPGLDRWAFGYDAGDPGRIVSAGRLDGSNSPTLTTKVAYNAPLSGGGLPDLTASAVAGWGQSDRPITATALFGPGHDPASGWDGAQLSYLDEQGRLVNTAEQKTGSASSWAVTTTEYDNHDLPVRTLTAANRERVLANSTLATKLDTQTTYANPADDQHIDATQVLGPQHAIRLPGATDTVLARRKTTTSYLANGSGKSEHLPTQTDEAAVVVGQSGDQDLRTTTMDYNGAGGMVARKPTTTIVDPGSGHLAITSSATYDTATGQQTTSTMPAGGSARQTFTRYYATDASSGDGACNNRPWYAGLPCKGGPAAQPSGSLPTIPITTYLYNRLWQPTSDIDALAAGDTRTATTSYDAAGRVTGTTVAASSGVADPVPSTNQSYDPSTGLPTTITAAGKTLTSSYDTLGRMTGYTDADGVTSTTGYDSRGRVSHSDDGKGAQDLAYDPTTDQLTTLTDSAAGVFTAAYDADGQATQQTYPNGLQATTTYDETGDPTHLQYIKITNCSSSCTWYDEQVDSSIHGQWLHRASTLSNQDYAYDQAGRLTQVNDTDVKNNQPCTQRRYSYDPDSNRTGQVAGASCTSGSGGTNASHSYDEADRLTDAATGYDKLGNTTALAAANAGGYAITSTYYADDRLHTQTQAAITETQDLDPARRIRTLTVAGQTTRVDTYHYSDDGDSPAWIGSSPGSWSRNVQGPGGDLAAIQDGANGTVTLQLSNLHGDIIATATTSSTATGLTGTQEQTEFGEPRTPSLARYGYLGAKQRQLTFPWGTIQMGQRSYIPQIGRFLQPDPVAGGSANAYDYANQDPFTQTDLDGDAAQCRPQVCPPIIVCVQVRVERKGGGKKGGGKKGGGKSRGQPDRQGGKRGKPHKRPKGGSKRPDDHTNPRPGDAAKRPPYRKRPKRHRGPYPPPEA
ncbi:MAG: RHS repeat-associated core domain-containing protein [Solirubrobacteraceae bacterium]